jgi:tRNA modification GTPase
MLKPRLPQQASADTIAAIASAQGRGGVGIIRISGCGLEQITENVVGRSLSPRHATLCEFLAQDGVAIDTGIAIFFPSPHSYTGEDVLELQGHGGSAVMQLVLNRCLDLGARLARPGEFTERAFLNGKMDLAQAESVADLIEANTAQAAASAVRSLRGEFSEAIHRLIDQLIYLRMLVEAMLDFPEEQIDRTDIDLRNRLLQALQDSLQATLDRAKQGCLLREGAHIAIVGQPNVGKSSLLNRLSGEEVALVSDIPGTTRDVIRQAIQINGIPLHIMDTAGLRETSDTVESMGIERAKATAHAADLVLLMVDVTRGDPALDLKLVADFPRSVRVIITLNKTDLGKAFPFDTMGLPCVPISVKTGQGLEELRCEILTAVGWRETESGAFMARERHLRALYRAKEHLDFAAGIVAQDELFAEELRQAQDALSEILGEFTPDDLLGEVFSRFCIGK